MVDELHVAHRFFALSCLAPFSRKCPWQLCQRVYMLLIVLLYIVFAVVGLVLYSWDYKESVITNLASLLLYVGIAFAWLAIALEASLTYERHYAFLDRSRRIKELFRQRLQLRVCQRSVRVRQWRKVIFYVVVVYGLLACKGLVVFELEAYCYYYLMTLPAIVIIRLRCLQATIYMDYIALYAQMLNGKLSTLASCKLAIRRARSDVNCEQVLSLDYLLTVKLLYREIYEFTLLFCDCFGWSLVAAFTVMFFDMLVNIYWAFMALCNTYPLAVAYLVQLTVLPLLVVITMTSYSGEQCRQQGRIALRHVQRLLGGEQPNGTAAAYTDVVREFSMQIMQDTIEIDAKQYFVVDLKLVMKIFTAMFTYLVILLQFSTHGEVGADANE